MNDNPSRMEAIDQTMTEEQRRAAIELAKTVLRPTSDWAPNTRLIAAALLFEVDAHDKIRELNRTQCNYAQDLKSLIAEKDKVLEHYAGFEIQIGAKGGVYDPKLGDTEMKTIYDWSFPNLAKQALSLTPESLAGKARAAEKLIGLMAEVVPSLISNGKDVSLVKDIQKVLDVLDKK